MTPSRPIRRAMPMDLKVALKNITPDQAQTLLDQATQAYFNLLTGQLPLAVETPQLGRVQFADVSPADLQRLIDYLNGIVAGNGDGTGASVRKPFSFFAWP